MKKNTDVHTEHCCKRHGCKYMDQECTVYHGDKTQSYDCESCEYEYSEQNSDFRFVKWLSDNNYLNENWEDIYKRYLDNGAIAQMD